MRAEQPGTVLASAVALVCAAPERHGRDWLAIDIGSVLEPENPARGIANFSRDSFLVRRFVPVSGELECAGGRPERLVAILAVEPVGVSDGSERPLAWIPRRVGRRAARE